MRITILVIGVFAAVDAVRALRLLIKLKSVAPAGAAPAAVRRAV